MRPEQERAVLEAIAAQSNDDRKTPALTARLVKDLGFDDLAVIEMVIDIECRLSIEIPDEDQPELWKTVQDVLNYVRKKV